MRSYPFFVRGDLNALFTLFLDNLLNLVILSSILKFGFKFPEDIIYQYMIPGTAFGVMFGDLVYTWLGHRLAKKTGRNDITAMPLGLDTPSTIGMAVFVLGPAFLGYQTLLLGKFPADKLIHQAGMMTWYTGMAVMIWMGLAKTVTAFLGDSIRRIVPAAGLLGSIAGIGLVWLSAEQFTHTMQMPLAGLTVLALVIVTLVAHYRLPWNLPGAAVAVIAGLIVYYVTGALGIFGGRLPEFTSSALGLTFHPFDTGWISFFMTDAVRFLPVAVPFGLLTVIGGINVTESARLSGDAYETRDILVTEAIATILAGLTGGVSQSTPYIGHSAYKKMGARSGYTFVTALLVGIGGMTGIVGFIVNLIPQTVVAPILIFIGFEITMLAYQATPAEYNMAVSVAILPSILNFGYTKIKLLMEPVLRFQNMIAGMNTSVTIKNAAAAIIPFSVAAEYPYLEAMAQGFLITGMLWGAATAFVIERKLAKASITLIIGGILSLFGIIHSSTASGEMYLPWNIPMNQYIPWNFASAYILGGIVIWVTGKISTAE